jgi:hypothetical protein
MDTDSLIRGLSRDAAVSGIRLGRRLAIGLAVAAGLAAIVWLVLLGPRADFAEAAATLRFPFKFVVTLALAVTAALAWRAAARPGTPLAPAAALLLVAPVLLAAGVVAELVALPEAERMARLIGTNSMVCLTFIPLLGVLPLAALLAALRQGAPTRPMLAGAFCGLVAGGLAATFYASHCIDDSPLFVAVWYSIAIAMLTLAGALCGRFVLRW